MAASFSSPNPDFKLLFEIHHFYVEGKANTEKTFRRPHATEGESARKRRPQARERRAPGVGGMEEV